MLFFEESKFKMCGNNRKTFFRQTENQAFLNASIKYTVTQDGGNMKVWCCFSYNGVDDLYKIKGTLTEQKYDSTL